MADDSVDWTAPGIVNPDGKGPFVLLCCHASNHIPAALDGLGLPAAELVRHIAWDPGALGISRLLSAALDAPVIHPTTSRLVIDCNRADSAADLIPARSELTDIPGNAELTEAGRADRIAGVHTPYHAAIDRVLAARDQAGLTSVLVAVHSFTPVYKGVARPWAIGILSDRDRRLADPLLAELAGEPALVIGDNEPYAPKDGVYYTLDRHGTVKGRATVMLEIRQDLLGDALGEKAWADRLAAALPRALAALQ